MEENHLRQLPELSLAEKPVHTGFIFLHGIASGESEYHAPEPDPDAVYETSTAKGLTKSVVFATPQGGFSNGVFSVDNFVDINGRTRFLLACFRSEIVFIEF
ncbi:hypothetical protein ACJU26_15650 [Acidithiobacillus sp. M4-SHS-6]|uniref:hypothetical protein n=1 Tax=Acidithiobacillus sp. M4-SHS-6 TaxID=3383024 RepID=UPI0039BDB252